MMKNKLKNFWISDVSTDILVGIAMWSVIFYILIILTTIFLAITKINGPVYIAYFIIAMEFILSFFIGFSLRKLIGKLYKKLEPIMNKMFYFIGDRTSILLMLLTLGIGIYFVFQLIPNSQNLIKEFKKATAFFQL